MNRVVSDILARPEVSHHIIDFGGKIRNAGLFDHTLSYSKTSNWTYTPERNNLMDYDKDYLVQNLPAYDKLVEGNTRLKPMKHRYVDEAWDLEDDGVSYYHFIWVDVLTYYVSPTLLKRKF
jgi:hypothetical protein